MTYSSPLRTADIGSSRETGIGTPVVHVFDAGS